jgi:nucleoid-associated protein YgaU
MGLLDNIFDKDDRDKNKKKADFSDVRSDSSSTAPETPVQQSPIGDQSLSQDRTYTVVAGDSLSKIAKREYGDASQWKRIYDANKDEIKNPDLIYPGQTFRIPGGQGGAR